jgi:hypothetical protein
MYAPAPFRRRARGGALPNVGAVRILLLLYAAYAVAAAFLLGTTGAVVSTVAGAASLVLALRPSRRMTIGLHLLLVPAQFVLSVPSNVPLLGMLLSTGVLVAARPVFGRLRPRLRKAFVTAHVGLSVGWLGLATAMTALAVTGLTTADPGLRHHVYRIMHLFDLVIVIPTVVLAIVSGLVVSLGTQWGLVRHRWVLAKFVLSLGIPLVAGFQHLWISELIDRTAADPGATAGGLGVRLLVCFVAYDVTLWTATGLSVFKPGGRTRWAERHDASSPRRRSEVRRR